MHEDPQVPNYGKPGKGPLLEEGMVLAIEPMTTAGRPGVRVGGDGWAIFSQDGSAAAHFEFTVAITAAGPRDPDARGTCARRDAGAASRAPARLRLRPHAGSRDARLSLLPSGVLPERQAFAPARGHVLDPVAAAATAARAESPEPSRRKGS